MTVAVIDGVEGPSLYVNDYRVLGNKPWGGGQVLHEWKVKREDLDEHLEKALR